MKIIISILLLLVGTAGLGCGFYFYGLEGTTGWPQHWPSFLGLYDNQTRMICVVLSFGVGGLLFITGIMMIVKATGESIY